MGTSLSPEIVWHQPGDSRFSDTYTRIATVGGPLEQMMVVSKGSFATTVAKHYMKNGDLVAVEIEFAGERDSVKLSQPGIDLLRISDGRIVEAWLFSSAPGEEDNFWDK